MPPISLLGRVAAPLIVGLLALSGCAPDATPSATAPVSTATTPVTTAPTSTTPATTTPAASPTPPPTADPVADVTVSIATLDVYGDDVEASGLVSGVEEDGGVCLLTLQQSGRTVTGETIGVGSRGVTNCGTIDIALSQLGSGEWAATLEYRSDTHFGRSDAATVTVP